MVNCPYCDKQFNNWMQVRKHTSACKLTTREYIITLEYGPISYKELSLITSREFKSKYPLIPVNTVDGIRRALRKRGILSWKPMTKEQVKDAFIRFYNENNRSPTSRDCYSVYYLPTDILCKELFGTLNKAVEYAGLQISSNNGYGHLTIANDGVTYKSSLEARFVNKYLYNKFEYEYEKPYPIENCSRISDFYIYELDLYIEVAGGLRAEVIQEKIALCMTNNLKLKVIYPKDIYKDRNLFFT